MTYLSPTKCLQTFGLPEKESSLTLFKVPTNLVVGNIPAKIYCNQRLVAPLTGFFRELVEKGLYTEITSWGGCFNNRGQRRDASKKSLHAWGCAIDMNAESMPLDAPNLWSPEFLAVAEKYFDWGGHWKNKDCMHFQLKDF